MIYRSSVRVTDGYVFVPTDKNISRKLQINREDSPELLPSSKRHVWGRLLTLGSVGVKVSYCNDHCCTAMLKIISTLANGWLTEHNA